jgi:transposase
MSAQEQMEAFAQAVAEVEPGEWMAEASAWFDLHPDSVRRYVSRRHPEVWAEYRAKRDAYRAGQADEAERLLRSGHKLADVADAVGLSVCWVNKLALERGVGVRAKSYDRESYRRAWAKLTRRRPASTRELADAAGVSIWLVQSWVRKRCLPWLVLAGHRKMANGHPERLFRAVAP